MPSLIRGKLHINGRSFPETYPVIPGSLSLGKGRLFEGRYALAGDNRSIPLPSSVHAVVPQRQIVGKVAHVLSFTGS